MRTYDFLVKTSYHLESNKGILRDVEGVNSRLTLSGIMADDSETDERILGGVNDEIWSAFKAKQPVSPAQIRSVILQRLLQFWTPQQAYLKAMERK